MTTRTQDQLLRLPYAMPPQRFDRTGLLCIDPRAFFELFMVPSTRANVYTDQVAIVDVSGPLVQRADGWCDSYEAIRARFREAIESTARVVVMRFDSPGGDASGCFETARALRAEADAAAKPLLAYIDRACSAAYALASAAHYVAIGETCCAGSIGVLSSRADQTAMNTARGLRFAFVVSGQRKLDGNPDAPVTDDELLNTQQHVDGLASKFFALISEQRAQLSAEQIAGFDGGVFYGDAAVTSGLADMVSTFDELLAFAGSEAINMTALLTQQGSLLAKSSDYESARAYLQKAAKGRDANAVAAKRALAAMAEAEPPPDEPEKEPDGDECSGDPPPPAAGDPPEETDEEEEKEEPAPAAEGETVEPAAETSEPPPAAKTAAPPAARSTAELTLAAKVHRLEARLAAGEEAAERKRLFAQRPDFGPELRAALAKAPLATVRDMVKTLPRGKVPSAKKPPITTVATARTETPTTRSAEALDMDKRMGLVRSKIGCRRDGSTMYFGVMDDDKPVQPSAAPQNVGA